ncbi:MAG: ATP-dependent DNA helicase RecG [bacterium]|nr:ATP-dependent DNA helicase RecG [bacterium]
MNEGLDTPVQYLKGVGPVRAKLLAKLNINNVKELFYLTPRRYVKRKYIKDVRYGEEAYVRGRVVYQRARFSRKGEIITLVIDDGTGLLECGFFNSPFLKDKFRDGDEIGLIGKTTFFARKIQFINPEIDTDPGLASIPIIPVYPLTSGIRQRYIRKITRLGFERYINHITETLPQDIILRNNLYPLPTALRYLHFPKSVEEAKRARERLGFEELFLFEIIMQKRRLEKKKKGIKFKEGCGYARALLSYLGFDFTRAQRKVLREIFSDMESPHQMHRLLQGDVGSGKTIVAAICMLKAVESGYQTALMAPTEVLAEQHYFVLSELLSNLKNNHVIPYLLTGSTNSREREEIFKKIRSGEAGIVIGTHALIEEEVEFKSLGLCVIDEQHRFGVMQRLALKEKGEYPDLLVMTATPIPRSLSLTLYGDLDISVLDELPAGRQSVVTKWVQGTGKRKNIYEFIKEKIDLGRQAYIVYPLIEESEKIDLEAAKEGYEKLRKSIFRGYKVSLLHGRMKGKKKEETMRAFRDGEIQILVSTTVIEVGVDVPNATVMVIEHAERFGLAQLHQLRGRIGRGKEKSYCILLTPQRVGEEAKNRLSVIEGENDGFKIAEEDLKIRGPGEFFGTRQSGIPELSSPDLIMDTRLLVRARDEAIRLLEDDLDLQKSENGIIRKSILTRYKDKIALTEAG